MEQKIKSIVEIIRIQKIDCLKGMILIIIAGWLCFRDIGFCLCGMGLLPFYLRYKWKERERDRKSEVWKQFRDMTAMLYSSTASGATLEKALRDARRDMCIAKGRYTYLLPEVERMCLGMDSNLSIEEVLKDFADRNQDEDITSFTQVLLIARKSGGNLSDIIQYTVENMNMRLEVNSEIENILAGKKGELKVMMIVPPCILVYMNIFSGEYMSFLYNTLAGRGVMLITLIVYCMAVFIGEKILDIRI